MKKILSLITVFCLILSLLAFASCDKGSKETSPETKKPTEDATDGATEGETAVTVPTVAEKTPEQLYNEASSLLASVTKYEISFYEGYSAQIAGELIESGGSVILRANGDSAECLYSDGPARTFVDNVMCYVDGSFAQRINIDKNEFFKDYMIPLASAMLPLESELFSNKKFEKNDELYVLKFSFTPEELAKYVSGSFSGNSKYEVAFDGEGKLVSVELKFNYLASGGTLVMTENKFEFTKLGSAGEIKLPEIECLDMTAIESIEGVIESDEATDYVLLDVQDKGKILIKLFDEIAPESVANFKKLVKEGFYDGTVFHRIIESFMIQGGGFTAEMEQKSAETIKGEFLVNGFENKLRHTRGIVSMARANAYDSASSQFFIMHATTQSLDGNYAAFGCVIYGMDTVDKIATAETDSSDKPLETIVINSAKFVNLP